FRAEARRRQQWNSQAPQAKPVTPDTARQLATLPHARAAGIVAWYHGRLLRGNRAVFATFVVAPLFLAGTMEKQEILGQPFRYASRGLTLSESVLAQLGFSSDAALASAPGYELEVEVRQGPATSGQLLALLNADREAVQASDEPLLRKVMAQL